MNNSSYSRLSEAAPPNTPSPPHLLLQRNSGTTVNMFIGEYKNGAGEIEEPARSVMIESPTCSGKTTMALIIAKVMSELLGARIGWVAIRERI